MKTLPLNEVFFKIKIGMFFQLALFYYSLKNKELGAQKQGFGQAGVGGGILEKENQNFLPYNPPDLVRKENLAPLSKTLRTVPIILPNSIHQSKERNLKK